MSKEDLKFNILLYDMNWGDEIYYLEKRIK